MNKLETVQLNNGLTIYLYYDSRRHSTFFQFITYFGGLTKDFQYQGKDYHMNDGIAHMLEHYIVECNDEGNFLKILGKNQMNTNASTHYQMTRFYFDAVENIEFGIRTMLNGIYHVSFDEEKFQKIKNPICQEIRGKSTNKFYQSNIAIMDNLFPDLHFHSIGGTIEEVENTTLEEVKTCYEAFYQPSNQFIVIAGNFEKDKILQEIKNFYQGLSFPKMNAFLLPIPADLSVKKKREIIYYPTSLEHVTFSFKIDIQNISSKDLLDLDFYLGCFFHHFFGITSSLYQKLVQNKIITAGISCSHSIFHHYLLIHIGGYTYHTSLFQKYILETIHNLRDFSKEKFELDKKASIVRLILRDENIMDMILPFVDNVVIYHYPFLDTVQDIESLTYSHYIKAIQNLDFSHYTVTIIKNPKKE